MLTLSGGHFSEGRRPLSLLRTHTCVRGPLIAKDNPPCGVGRRFPRAPTISNDETMQTVTFETGWREETERACRGQIEKSAARYGRIGTAIFKKCQYVVQPGVSAEGFRTEVGNR